jgi:hypothetical protein
MAWAKLGAPLDRGCDAGHIRARFPQAFRFATRHPVEEGEFSEEEATAVASHLRDLGYIE